MTLQYYRDSWPNAAVLNRKEINTEDHWERTKNAYNYVKYDGQKYH